MGAEPVSPEDATLLCATGPGNQLQIGALCFFEAGPLRDGDGRLRVDDLRAHVEARLDRFPRFRQRIARVPFDAARPVWVDDERFDLTRHLRVAELPAPADRAALESFVADLLSRPLDPERPLWEIWSVDGTGDDCVPVVLRVHHAMADGLSLLRAALLLLDAEPRDEPEPVAAPWVPRRPPGPLRLLVGATFDRHRHQVALAGRLARVALDPRRTVAGCRAVLSAASHLPPLVPSTELDGPVGRRRRVVWGSLPLDDLLDVAHARGTTLNDLVLAATADGVGRHLGPRTAAALSRRPPRVIVPVGGADPGGDGNAFSFFVTDLPVGPLEPTDRLARVHRDAAAGKAADTSAALGWFSVIDVLPVPLVRRLGPPALARQPFVNLAVTNVPGTRDPMYLLGSRMESAHPIVTGVGNIACIVAVLSYRNRLNVGITVDPDVVADPEGLIGHVLDAAADLVRA